MTVGDPRFGNDKWAVIIIVENTRFNAPLLVVFIAELLVIRALPFDVITRRMKKKKTLVRQI